MATSFPCPNPTCGQVFSPDAIKGATSLVCPRCGTPAPKTRMPTSLDETLWGGSTCQNCGCNFDKWGRDLSRPGATSGR